MVLDSKSLVNEPFSVSGSQPITLTSAPLSSLNFSTPCAKPVMKMVTVGISSPPKVPTTPVSDFAAAR